MTGAEIVAVISVSTTSLSGLLLTCYHSRCTDIDCWGIKCKRELIKDDKEVVARPVE
tara:strand:- start:364 stop:534 length:171 start_codon:yes stop_codon:yes gene_type:complete